MLLADYHSKRKRNIFFFLQREHKQGKHILTTIQKRPHKQQGTSAVPPVRPRQVPATAQTWIRSISSLILERFYRIFPTKYILGLCCTINWSEHVSFQHKFKFQVQEDNPLTSQLPRNTRVTQKTRTRKHCECNRDQALI